MKQLTMGSDSFLSFVRQAIIVACSVHSVFILLFSILKIPVLIVTNIGSLLLYAAAIWLIASSSFRAIATLFWIDLAGHALISSEVLGWYSGFHFYLLMLIPMCFLYTSCSQTKRIYLIELIILFYLVLDYHSYSKPAMVELSPLFLELMRYANMTIAIGGLTYQIHIYKTLLQQDVSSTESSLTDQLTGLHNRYAILNKIDELFSSSSHARQPMALVIADIDHFKLLNEQYGQATGDDVLVYVAQILHASVRHNDRASRWGGSEFLLLLPGGSLDSAEKIALRAQKKLSTEPFNVKGKSISVSMTFGVAELLPDEDFNQCLIRADIALQRGKQNGRNRIELASENDAVAASV